VDYDVFDNMVEGVQIIGPDLRYVYANDTVAVRGETTRRSLVGRRMSECYPCIEETEICTAIQACLAEGRPSQLIDAFTFPDGSVGYVQLRIQPVAEGALVLSFDVTDQRRAEIAMRDLNVALEARVRERGALVRAKNEELEQIAYIMSHHLQEPLRTIQSFVDVLREDGTEKLHGDAGAAVNFIVDASRRIQTLVKALLDFSCLDRPRDRGEAALEELLDSVLHNLHASIEETGAQVEADPLPTLTVYPAEFEQLLHNLVSNALKFRRPDVRPHIRISAQDGPEAWTFHVSDNGIGFDMQSADKIFRVFHRLHKRSSYEGTGIGLANCRKIVSLHRGKIWCESEPGMGSTFSFSIPVVQEPGKESCL